MPNMWLKDNEIASGITQRLQALERGGEGVISYAVLGLINRDGDVTVGEFFDTFLPAKATAGAKQTKAAAEAKRIRNRHSQYFAAAKVIYTAHGEYIQKQLMKLPTDAQTTTGAVAFVDKYLWKAVDASGRYRNEHHARVHLAKAKTERDASELQDSYVKAVIKRFGGEILTPDNIEKMRDALDLAEARYLAQDETETENTEEQRLAA